MTSIQIQFINAFAGTDPLKVEKSEKYVLCSEGVLNTFDYERLIIEDIRKRYLKLNDIDSKIIPLTSGQIRKNSKIQATNWPGSFKCTNGPGIFENLIAILNFQK